MKAVHVGWTLSTSAPVCKGSGGETHWVWGFRFTLAETGYQSKLANRWWLWGEEQ